ncbi:hypothetical protein predicted by Glimmer/Critica [Lactiplantibacillus plantarum]|nr:hypothetical protein predicted by Glimmer/Critica [Lactiplantibacillus plantarum]
MIAMAITHFLRAFKTALVGIKYNTTSHIIRTGGR